MNVILLAAITADGFIGKTDDSRSFDWTSLEDKKFYVESIKKAGVVVMGSTSFKTFTKYPKGLEFIIYTRSPEQFVNPKPEVINAWATNQSPQELIENLGGRGIESVAICGGASIYSQFLQVGVIDKLYLTVESIVFGQGIKLFAEEIDQKLHLNQVLHLSDQTIVLEYDVLKNAS